MSPVTRHPSPVVVDTSSIHDARRDADADNEDVEPVVHAPRAASDDEDEDGDDDASGRTERVRERRRRTGDV